MNFFSWYSAQPEFPEEPPPTFEEAMNTPPYSAGSSSLHSISPSHPSSSPSNLHQNTRTRPTPALLDDPPINNSTESLELIDKEEGIDPQDRSIRGRPGMIQAESSKHRRHMSLSPLRTFTALTKHRKNVDSVSSQPGSPVSMASFSAFRSVTSLPLQSSSGSLRERSGLSRRLFRGASKGKGRETEHEEEDEWEVVDRTSSNGDGEPSAASLPSSRPASAESSTYQESIPPSSTYQESISPSSTHDVYEPEQRVPSRAASITSSQHEEYASQRRTEAYALASQQDLTNTYEETHEEDVVVHPTPQRAPLRLGISQEGFQRTGSPLSAVSWVSATDFESSSYCTAMSERTISEATIRDSEYSLNPTLRDSSDYGSIVSGSSVGTVHYPGRPLPRPPAPSTYRSMYDSIYAGPSTESISSRPESPCQEGLLIDFAEPSADRSYSQDTLRAFTGARSSVASTDTIGSFNARSSVASTDTTGSFNTAASGTSSDRYSDVTELDVMASRMNDESSRRGSDYEVRSFSVL